MRRSTPANTDPIIALSNSCRLLLPNLEFFAIITLSKKGPYEIKSHHTRNLDCRSPAHRLQYVRLPLGSALLRPCLLLARRRIICVFPLLFNPSTSLKT